MRRLLIWFAVCLTTSSAFAAPVWNPTGKYGYSVETGIPEHSENHYYLQIKPWESPKKHPKNSYSVSMDIVQGPTGHMCAFQGDGVLKDGALVVTPDERMKNSPDDDWWHNCRIKITRNEDDSVNVSEDYEGNCRKLFFCGARTGIGTSDLKRNDSIDDIPFYVPSP